MFTMQKQNAQQIIFNRLSIDNNIVVSGVIGELCLFNDKNFMYLMY